jgi:hypothetical protein
MLNLYYNFVLKNIKNIKNEVPQSQHFISFVLSFSRAKEFTLFGVYGF